MKRLLFPVLLITSILFAMSASAETVWRGLLTVDTYPENGCVVTEFANLRSENWVSAARLEQFQAFVSDLERKYEKDAASQGFNAILGYKIIFIGGSEGVNQMGGPFISGLVKLNGVAVKVKCVSADGSLPNKSLQGTRK